MLHRITEGAPCPEAKFSLFHHIKHCKATIAKQEFQSKPSKNSKTKPRNKNFKVKRVPSTGSLLEVF